MRRGGALIPSIVEDSLPIFDVGLPMMIEFSQMVGSCAPIQLMWLSEGLGPFHDLIILL